MIKATMKVGADSRVVLLGLARRNCELLLQDQPIAFDGHGLGFPRTLFCIMVVPFDAGGGIRITTEDGVTTVALALVPSDLPILLAGEQMYFSGLRINTAVTNILLIAGETEDTIKAEIARHLPIAADVVVDARPRANPTLH